MQGQCPVDILASLALAALADILPAACTSPGKALGATLVSASGTAKPGRPSEQAPRPPPSRGPRARARARPRAGGGAQNTLVLER